MRSHSLIKSYLESLLEFTLADSVNLYFPANQALGLEKKVMTTGQKTLIEFSQPEQNFDLNSLQDTIDGEAHRVINGKEAGTVLVSLATTILNTAGKNKSGRSSRRPISSSNADLNLCWLGLTFSGAVPNWLCCVTQSKSLNKEDARICHLFHNLVDFGSHQLGQIESQSSLLIDPLTGLPCRTKFQSQISQLFQQFPNVAVLMIHSPEFHQINKKFGHESGDSVIWEIGQNLLKSIRETDLVSRFGGALFAIAVAVHEEQEAIQLAQKIQQYLQQREYLGGAISLGFNVGIGIVKVAEAHSSQTERVASLINRADQALKASQGNTQPTITLWQQEQMDVYNQRVDYIGGIFTADTATDYRNMLLLWDISNIIASKNQFDDLLQQVVHRLGQTFDFEYAGIIEYTEARPGGNQKVYLLDEDANTSMLDTLPSQIRENVSTLTNTVANTTKPQQSDIDGNVLFAAPLNQSGKSCFFIVSDAEKLTLTSDSRMLFTALTKQLGRALNRTRLEEQLNQQLEQQKQQLQNELTQLKEDLQSSSMFYCSSAMEQLMKQAKRAAMTDTTTLIIGESGTGKERLVSSLHKMGSRQHKPLIIVDCGAIPETLIESELFGHLKGAFTGAQNTSKGKVYEADGGTLMLDEIGELPLQMQTKLLRFVQEKHYTPVGATKAETVDVKIIAVTNRELEQEVEKGNFRQDLFYRLNVLTLRTPPLRERPEDIPLLAKHFLKRFAQQFNHANKQLSDDALEKMLAYQWPGNIRELENRLMQANLLSDHNVIEWQDLKIQDKPELKNTPVSEAITQPISAAVSELPASANNTPLATIVTSDPDKHSDLPAVAGFDMPSPLPSTDVLANLENVLVEQVSNIVSQHDVTEFPIGNWVEDDLIYLTYLNLNKSVKHTGLRLGISHSTLRRKIDRILKQPTLEETRPNNWSQILNALKPIAQGAIKLSSQPTNQLKLTILASILAASPNNMAIAAELMGVSEPTLYKLKKQLIKSTQSAEQTEYQM